jgi:hypothetical protein
MESRPASLGHSGLMFANFITLAHFFGFIHDDLAEIGGRAGKQIAT